jgi:hypothetical protein
VTGELARLTGELEQRLPEHTFNAVVRRAEHCESDESHIALLADVLSERERSEVADQAGAAA